MKISDSAAIAATDYSVSYFNFVIVGFIVVRKHILPYFWFWFNIWQIKLKCLQACSEVGAAGSDRPFADKVLDFKDAFWRFLRPHTIRGTALGSLWVALRLPSMCCLQLHHSSYILTDFHFNPIVYSALVSRALIENSNLIKWSLLLKALSGLFALICGNGYIVGINQIYDIGIDKYDADRHIDDCLITYFLLLVHSFSLFRLLLHISCQFSIFFFWVMFNCTIVSI